MGAGLAGDHHQEVTSSRPARISALAAAGALILAACSHSQAQGFDIETVIVGTSEYQLQILDDRTVEPEEYERAVLAAWDCVSSAGFSPQEPTWTQGQYIFSTEITAADEEALQTLNARYETAYAECEAEYLNDVATVWAFQIALTPEERAAIRPDVIACLQRNNVEVATDADDSGVYEAMRPEETNLWSPCVEEYPGYFTTISTT